MNTVGLLDHSTIRYYRDYQTIDSSKIMAIQSSSRLIKTFCAVDVNVELSKLQCFAIHRRTLKVYTQSTSTAENLINGRRMIGHITWPHDLYPLDAMLAWVIAIVTCLSVRPTVTSWYCVKMKKASIMICSP